jgi:hypothetical protein
MPIQDASNIKTKVVYGTHLTIHTELQTALRTLGAQDEIFSINIVRKSVGNQFMAVISYEDVPTP